MDVGAQTLEGFRMSKLFLLFFVCTSFIFSSSCKTFLKYEKENELAKNTEFEKQVVVKTVEEKPVDPIPIAVSEKKQTALTVPLIEAKLKVVVKKNKKVSTKTKSPEAVIISARQPELEDNEGFDHQRRPINDPFRVGEKVVHSVRFFAAEAGTLTLEVLPFSEVNSKKSYHFQIGLQTSRLFSSVYSVEDLVDTYVDYVDLVPHVFKTSIRESGKLAQAQGFFNQSTLKSNYWEKKYTKKNGEEEIKKSWDLLPFSQNAFSSIFYMRVFNWKIGKEYSFRVSDDEKNVVFKATAVAKEKIDTDAGEFQAIKIKADIFSRGALTTSHPLLLWISDDDRKLILRIEADIKIGSLVSEIVEIDKGKP